jgi:MHS family proline/betaine transporter-like MFS transporter
MSRQEMGSPPTYKIIGAGMIGNVLEWYDFALYGYFAVPIGRHFFPREDAVAQLLFGRRAALSFSVVAMAIPTFAIGVLPGYAVLGVVAPIALTVMRIAQGLSVGGEYPSSMVFLVEHADKGRRGLLGAFACFGAVGGILLGSAMGAVFAAAMSTEALEAWGWRIPFLIGVPVGFAGLWLRRHVLETAPIKRSARPPIVETVREHGWLVARIAALTAFTAVPFHIMFIYIVSWLQLADGIAPAQALEFNTISMIAVLPVMVAAGWASDRYGRKPFLSAATVLGFVCAVPLFWLMLHPPLALVGQLGFIVIIGLYIGVHPVVLVEAAPPPVRCTAVALGYNLCLAVIGGLTPLVATWLVERTENELSPGFLIMAAAVVTFGAVLRSDETYRKPLGEMAAPPALAVTA